MEILNTILNYAPAVLGGIIIIAIAVITVKGELSKAKEWMIFAVTEAEKLLGSGTGKLKIRQTYDWFISKFPIFSTLVTYETFSKWVDEALITMRELIEKNALIDEYVNKGEAFNSARK